MFDVRKGLLLLLIIGFTAIVTTVTIYVYSQRQLNHVVDYEFSPDK